MSETQNKELAKSYDPASIEAKWYPFWEQQGYFKAGLEEGKPSFSIQLPPPNITGILHMGHAFNHSVMDSLTRFYRMNGYNTMWLPGTDHAVSQLRSLLNANWKLRVRIAAICLATIS